jgi:hypothetical protein
MGVMADSDKLNVFTHDERLILCAVAERIFPETDTPGAVEIGAVDYIETALAGDYAGQVPLYQNGVRALDRYARARFGKIFLYLNDTEKDGVLRDFEAGVPDFFKQAA